MDFRTLKPPAKAPVIFAFTATGPVVNGNASTLAWTVTGAASLSIDQGVGAVVGVSTTVSPAVTTTYTLTATKGSKTTTATVTVTVLGLVREDAGTVAHVYWNGSALVDSKGNTWTQNGTVPQVAASGAIPAGAGPFSDANHYSLGTGNDILDFAGNFAACIVYDKGSSGGNTVPFNNGTASTDGYFAQLNVSTKAFQAATIPANNIATSLTVAAGVEVGCWGRSGTNWLAKSDLGTLVTAGGAAITPATTTPARIGRYAATGNAFTGKIYELYFTTTTPTDALFISMMSAIRSALGISAW